MLSGSFSVSVPLRRGKDYVRGRKFVLLESSLKVRYYFSEYSLVSRVVLVNLFVLFYNFIDKFL